MWDWAHFKKLGWLSHSKQAARHSGLLILAAMAMLLHMIVPFWQQPERLQMKNLGKTLCGCASCENCECCQ